MTTGVICTNAADEWAQHRYRRHDSVWKRILIAQLKTPRILYLPEIGDPDSGYTAIILFSSGIQ